MSAEMTHLGLFSQSSPTTRNRLLTGALVAAATILLFEVATLLPRALEVWHPYDYGVYVQMGSAIRQGLDPNGPGRYYPLPTTLWIFLPLSLLPGWFRFIWILMPFAVILMRFRKEAVWLLGFVPLWFVMGDAMLDGWLLLPLSWLLDNKAGFAGLGAAVLLAKPQLALLTVGYMVVRWCAARNWKNLFAFSVGAVVFCLPAFLVEPSWPLHFVQVLPLRVGEASGDVPIIQASLWAWWRLGGTGVLIFFLLVLASAVLLLRAFRSDLHRAGAIQSVNLLLMPVLYAASLISILPALRNRRETLIVVGISLIAFALDRALGGFGGGYSLIPLAALYFGACRAGADYGC